MYVFQDVITFLLWCGCVYLCVACEFRCTVTFMDIRGEKTFSCMAAKIAPNKNRYRYTLLRADIHMNNVTKCPDYIPLSTVKCVYIQWNLDLRTP